MGRFYVLQVKYTNAGDNQSILVGAKRTLTSARAMADMLTHDSGLCHAVEDGRGETHWIVTTGTLDDRGYNRPPHLSTYPLG